MFSQRSNLLLSIAGIILLMGPATTTARAIDTPENQHHEQKKQTSNEQSATTTSEGPAVTAEIEVGPFDLKQKYRSMEGPYVRVPLKIADILAEKNVSIPESYVKIPGAAQAGPGMTGSADGASMQPGRLRSMSNDGAISADGAGNAANQKRELLWLKSVKIDMLDENDKPLPDAAFFCHATIDVDLDFRNQVFPASEHPGNMRHIVLTQGQTQFAFPNGFALPVASDESWNFVFQTINRTSDVPRKVKGRCLLTFVKDSELVYPIKALFWYYPVINVVIDRNSAERIKAERKSCPDCSAISEGVPAPSSMRNMIFTDKLGRSQIGHWVVPPGVHTYASPINTIGSMSTAKFAAADTDIHLVLTHVHPFCEKCVLIQHDKGQTKEIVTVKAKTDEKNLQLTEIDTISSVPGIPLEAGKSYELQATYNNTSSKPQDSMAGMALYCSDNKFVRPDWALAGNMNEAYCGTSYEQKSRKKAHSKAFGMRPN
ncbi:MAG: hypothetical protein JST44_13325 [Cyanobacteria bacterium SZAS LIN-5]|nr:hypothetical protein [Cyanobacteria bacterium SZAS LIN-5]RTL36062.1 MAG: hypothetical protein EKK48_27290 [Candidatus Melainabacteria bacterium]